MCTTAIIGAQFGSEGKGKIAAYISPEFELSVRSGGPNAGHTVSTTDYKYIFRHVPCAAVNRNTKLLLAAGSIIDCNVLFEELRMPLNVSERLVVDPQAAVIANDDAGAEERIKALIGSTGKGVGAALLKKIARDGTALLARDVEALKPFVGSVSTMLIHALHAGKNVLLEGTQGMGLSVHHGYYPFVTSRDVSVGSLCGEAGVPPMSVNEVILVVRPYPIRVAGNSGPLRNEISWEDVEKKSGSPKSLVEYTTVTGLVRRVGEFNIDEVRKSCQINGATSLALTFADHLDCSAFSCNSYRYLPATVKTFVRYLESDIGVPVKFIGTGPHTDHIVDLRH